MNVYKLQIRPKQRLLVSMYIHSGMKYILYAVQTHPQEKIVSNH